MADITLGGTPVQTNGTIPSKGDQLADFDLIKTDLSHCTLSDFKGQRVVLNIFPSVDTDTCATSVRKFNERASSMENTVVACVSRDLPFAQKRFCGAEGLDKVINLSDFRDGSFGRDYKLTFSNGPFEGLHSRVVIVADEEGKVLHSEQVQEVADEPNYDAAISALG